MIKLITRNCKVPKIANEINIQIWCLHVWYLRLITIMFCFVWRSGSNTAKQTCSCIQNQPGAADVSQSLNRWGEFYWFVFLMKLRVVFILTSTVSVRSFHFETICFRNNSNRIFRWSPSEKVDHFYSYFKRINTSIGMNSAVSDSKKHCWCKQWNSLHARYK